MIIGALSAVGYVVGIANSAPDLKSLKPQAPGRYSTVFASDGKTELGKISNDILSDPDPQRPDAAGRAQRDGRDRGPALLPPPRRRLRGHHPRGVQERELRQDDPGRVDADDAAHPHPLHGRPRSLAEAQGARGQARRGARERPSRPQGQEVDPHEVPQLRALRDQRRQAGDRHPGRRARVLQQARVAPDARRVRAARRPAAGAQRLQPVPGARRGDGAAQRGAAQDGRPRLHLRQRRAGGDRRAAGAAAQHVLSPEARELLLRLRDRRADQEVRPARRAQRRPADPHDDRPQAAAARRARRSPGA